MIIISNVSRRVDKDFSSEIEVRKGKKKKEKSNKHNNPSVKNTKTLRYE